MRKILTLFFVTLFSVSMFATDCYIAGDFTDWETHKFEMDNVTGNYFVANIQINAGALDEYNYTKFKVIDGSGWYADGSSFTASNLHAWKELSTSGGNMSLHVDEAGTYFTFIYDQSSKYFAVIFPDTKIVAAGSDALFGTSWDATDTNNALTTTDNYTYTWSKTDYDLAAGTYNFKVVVDEDWDNKSYPASDYELNIAKSGSYDVTITFSALDYAISATATLKDEHPVVPAIKLCRKWNLDPGEDYSEVDLTPAQDGLTASVTQTFAAADLGQYEFALKKGGTWTSNGGETTFDRDHRTAEITGNGGYMKIFVDVTSEITFTWTYATNTLTITYPDLPAKPVIAAKGYWNKWGAATVLTDNGTTASWSRHLSKGTYTFYMLHNGSMRCLDGNDHTRYEFRRNWRSAAIAGCGTEQTEMILNTDVPGDYTFTWTYESDLLTITYPDSLEVEFHVYSNVSGSWELDKLIASEDSWFTKSIVVSSTGTYAYKIKKIDNNENTPAVTWYGAENDGATMHSDDCTNWQLTTDGGGNNVNLDANKIGDYTFKFNAATAKMSVVYPTETALDETEVSSKAVKRMENGQLVIIKNGVKYNALGAEVK